MDCAILEIDRSFLVDAKKNVTPIITKISCYFFPIFVKKIINNKNTETPFSSIISLNSN